jgi:23S rRNA-/tRNA-specific pseudouridylate synthase
LDGLSRARLQALIGEGRLFFVPETGDPAVTDGSAKALAGVYRVLVPAPIAAEPAPEDIPLTVLYEDAYLIVVDKPRRHGRPSRPRQLYRHPGPRPAAPLQAAACPASAAWPGRASSIGWTRRPPA